MIAQITNIESNRFTLNGNYHKKHFQAEVVGDTHIRITSAYNTNVEILPPTEISSVEVDGTIHATMNDLTNALSSILFLTTPEFQTTVDTSIFELKSNKGTVNGYAPLDSSIKIPKSYYDVDLTDVTGLQQALNLKLGIDGTAADSIKLNGQFASYYATQSNTYTKAETDNEITTKVNEYYNLLLNNADAPINSIQELLDQLNSVDQTLINSIAEKVSYVQSQALTTAQKIIAQTNIGLENAALTTVDNDFDVNQTISNTLPRFRLVDSDAGGSNLIEAYYSFYRAVGQEDGYFGMKSDNLKLWTRNGEIDLLKNTNVTGVLGVSSDVNVGNNLVMGAGNIYLEYGSLVTLNNQHLRLYPNGTGDVYMGSSSNGATFYHYSRINDGVWTTYSHTASHSTYSTTAPNGFFFSGDVTATNFIGLLNGLDTGGSGNANTIARIDGNEDLNVKGDYYSKATGVWKKVLTQGNFIEGTDYDNYSHFNLKTEGIQRKMINSGEDLNFTCIDGFLNISYAANGTVQFSFNELSYSDLIDAPNLSIYATQAWVNSQGFLTSASGLATETYVNSQKFIKAETNAAYQDTQKIKKVTQAEYDALPAAEKNDEKIMFLIGNFQNILA